MAAPNITKHVLLQIEYFVEAGSQTSLPRNPKQHEPATENRKKENKKTHQRRPQARPPCPTDKTTSKKNQGTSENCFLVENSVRLVVYLN